MITTSKSTLTNVKFLTERALKNYKDIKDTKPTIAITNLIWDLKIIKGMNNENKINQELNNLLEKAINKRILMFSKK